MLRRALSDEHQALLCLKLCSDMEEVGSKKCSPVLKFNSGRSANVRASFGTLHSLSLRYVKLHQVASASAAGDFKLDMMLNMCFNMCYGVKYVF